MMRSIFIFLAFSLAISHSVAQKNSPQYYIEQYKDIAVSEMQRTGIPASITLAQGILESASGYSRLAVEANNHFGIKCHSSWKGETITHEDDSGSECFRKYTSVEESFHDHSEFIVNGSRYSSLFDLKPTDYKNWAKGLQFAGYATNLNYSSKLIELIERYKLYKYDKMQKVASSEPVKVKDLGTTNNSLQGVGKHQIKTFNRVAYIIALKGDTYYSLTSEFGKMQWELEKYNDIPEGVEPEEGQIVYLQPKRNKAPQEYKRHKVVAGETMWSISQKYAIRLKALYKKNCMQLGDEPVEGQQILLRYKKRAMK